MATASQRMSMQRSLYDQQVRSLQVSPQERAELAPWKRAYDARYFITSQQMDSLHMEEKINQVERTHAAKLSYFTTHSLPTANWIDVDEMNKDKSRAVGQATYFGSDMPVMTRLMKVPLVDKIQRPRVNLGSKTSNNIMPTHGRADRASGMGVTRKLGD